MWVFLFFVALWPFSPSSLTFNDLASFGARLPSFLFVASLYKGGSFKNPILIVFFSNIQITVF